jgi:hypothetical protein
MRTIAAILATTLLLGGAALAVDDPDNLMSGTVTVVKTGKLAKFVATPSAANPLPSATNDPTIAGGTLHMFDTGQLGNGDVYTLAASGWSRIPKKETKPLKGYKFKGSPCKQVLVKDNVVKAQCKGAAVQLDTPFVGNVGIVLTLGGSSKRYCASFGGTGKNDDKQVNRKNAPTPSACPVPLLPTTTTVAAPTTTTSTTLGQPSTTIILPTTTSTSETSTTSSTETSTTVTTTTSNSEPTTSSTSTTSTTLPGGGCCNGASFIRVETIDAAGDCGDIIDQTGMVVNNIACAGLFTGGGGNSVPLPFSVPDQGIAISAIDGCTGQTATLGGSTSAETGSNRNCTSTGCLFGAPLAVPNPGSTPTSVCVLNAASADVTGTAVCDTGATTVNLPLASVIFLTGDTATDPTSTIAGIQPCPLCSGGSCIGGPNNGDPCTPGTSTLGGNAAYPTSHDCPPDPMFSIGSLPIAFSLTSGTVSWSGTTATNDTGGTFSVQNRVFSGFCRDVGGTGGTGAFEGTSPATAHLCWENGMAQNAACAEPFESCEQRTNGAFGPAGGSNRTIIAIGNGSSILGGPTLGTLVSIFSIPPTFDPTVDSAGDLPGPGAVALPGTATLCSDAMTCP